MYFGCYFPFVFVTSGMTRFIYPDELLDIMLYWRPDGQRDPVCLPDSTSALRYDVQFDKLDGFDPGELRRWAVMSRQSRGRRIHWPPSWFPNRADINTAQRFISLLMLDSFFVSFESCVTKTPNKKKKESNINSTEAVAKTGSFPQNTNPLSIKS